MVLAMFSRKKESGIWWICDKFKNIKNIGIRKLKKLKDLTLIIIIH
jgi:hypothetical protein